MEILTSDPYNCWPLLLRKSVVILLLGALILGNGDGEGKSTLFLVNLLKRKEEICDYMEICIL